MQGQLAEHPLAELIREINRAGLSGALRLSRDRAKAAVYFDEGALIFAASNVRAHRLREVLKQNGVAERELKDCPSTMSDEDLAKHLQDSGRFTKETLKALRAKQAGDVLRVALLWTNGEWQFDDRVRLADDAGVRLDVPRLLLECARHLPFAFVRARFNGKRGSYSFVGAKSSTNLLPVEASVISRVANAGSSVSFDDLTKNGTTSEDSVRSVYALTLSGLLEPSIWPAAFGNVVQERSPQPLTPEPADNESTEPTVDDHAAANELFMRLTAAKDHYEVLDIPRAATDEEIKQAYHSLALRFHPDRFHQSDPSLRTRIESAFANIAQAYETLSDERLRTDYDKRILKIKPGATDREHKRSVGAGNFSQSDRAEASFRRGIQALTNKQLDEAISCFAEAALLEPREARYRANYGHALMSRPNMRRSAEFELQAAISLEPHNAPYRLMLAELYKQLGLLRRAENEAARALAIDPRNEAARILLSNLKRIKK